MVGHNVKCQGNDLKPLNNKLLLPQPTEPGICDKVHGTATKLYPTKLRTNGLRHDTCYWQRELHSSNKLPTAILW
jgi:hypothetical protein